MTRPLTHPPFVAFAVAGSEVVGAMKVPRRNLIYGRSGSSFVFRLDRQRSLSGQGPVRIYLLERRGSHDVFIHLPALRQETSGRGIHRGAKGGVPRMPTNADGPGYTCTAHPQPASSVTSPGDR
jgi:hypothetical protein